jgi:delta-aminolevulinic acid dehydratase/porphobilinogen synthase
VFLIRHSRALPSKASYRTVGRVDLTLENFIVPVFVSSKTDVYKPL